MRFSRMILAGAFLAILGLTVSAGLAATELKPNLEKSKIDFVGRKADGSHKGGFKKFELEAVADFEVPDNSSLKIVIDTESLWSDADKLTEHLRSEDFFNVKKYPKITFESTKIIHSEEPGKSKIVGKLNMLGKTVETQIPIEVVMSEESLKIVAKFKIDRTKWGMDYGQGKINDEVDVVAEFVFGR